MMQAFVGRDTVSSRLSSLRGRPMMPGRRNQPRQDLLRLVAIFAFVTLAFAQGPSTVLSKKTVQDAQVALKVLGYDPGPADGAMGAKTVAAVKKFQSDHDIPVSGMLDRKTTNVLTATPASTATQKSRADAKAAEAAALARVVSNVAALDEYKSLNVIDLVSAFDANKDIDALAPLERQAVLDVSLERLYVTRKPQVALPGVPISQAPGGVPSRRYRWAVNDRKHSWKTPQWNDL
jgi:peptidoglycan hydrolase-like protein with peptidoglycan-binding domain